MLSALVLVAALNSTACQGNDSLRIFLVHEMTTSSNPHTRASAATALADARYTPAVEPLISAMRNDADRIVQQHAAKALGKLGDRRATSALVDHAMEGNYDAFRALGRLADPTSVPRLVELWTLDDESLHADALRTIGKMGSAAYDPVVAALADSHWRVRAYSCNALVRIGDRKALDEIRPLLEDANPDVRAWAERAIEDLTAKP
jgi:HEAT repeat protein